MRLAIAAADLVRWVLYGLGVAVLGSRTLGALHRPPMVAAALLAALAVAGVGFFAVMGAAGTQLRRVHAQLGGRDQ